MIILELFSVLQEVALWQASIINCLLLDARGHEPTNFMNNLISVSLNESKSNAPFSCSLEKREQWLHERNLHAVSTLLSLRGKTLHCYIAAIFDNFICNCGLKTSRLVRESLVKLYIIYRYVISWDMAPHSRSIYIMFEFTRSVKSCFLYLFQKFLWHTLLNIANILC